jgi:hypothetical protein
MSGCHNPNPLTDQSIHEPAHLEKMTKDLVEETKAIEFRVHRLEERDKIGIAAYSGIKKELESLRNSNNAKNETHNKLSNQFYALVEMYKNISIQVAGLHEHHVRQIDENRKSFVRSESFEERLNKLEEHPDIYIEDIKNKLIEKRLDKLESICDSRIENDTLFSCHKCARKIITFSIKHWENANDGFVIVCNKCINILMDK